MENNKKLGRCTVGQLLDEKSRYYDASYKMDMLNWQFGSAMHNANKTIRYSKVSETHDKVCEQCSGIKR